MSSSLTLGPYESAVSMKLTFSSTALRSTRTASCASAGGPQIPGPVMRMAPNPNRFTVTPVPSVIVPAADAVLESTPLAVMRGSLVGCVWSHTLPAVPRFGKPQQQRCRLPARAMGRGKPLHRGDDPVEPDLLRPVHRATLVGRKSVPVHEHHVDVTRAHRNALFEYARALVHQRMQQAIQDFRLRQRPPCDPLLRRHGLDQLQDLRIGAASTALVTIEALAALLPQPPGGDEPLQNRRAALIGGQLTALADEQPDIVAGQVAHRQGTHGKPEVLDHPIDLLRRGSLLQQELGLVRVELQHAITDEAEIGRAS